MSGDFIAYARIIVACPLRLLRAASAIHTSSLRCGRARVRRLIAVIDRWHLMSYS